MWPFLLGQNGNYRAFCHLSLSIQGFRPRIRWTLLSVGLIVFIRKGYMMMKMSSDSITAVVETGNAFTKVLKIVKWLRNRMDLSVMPLMERSRRKLVVLAPVIACHFLE